MVAAVTCIFDGDEIGVAAALALRADGMASDDSPFSCVVCGEHVRPHQAGGHVRAHFEHLERNGDCPLSHVQRSVGGDPSPPDAQVNCITTAELEERTAGGISYIRTKDGVVQGLALRPDVNPLAPAIVIVEKGIEIEKRARLLMATANGVPTYLKRGRNAWELVGNYRATDYRTDAQTIKEFRATRPIRSIAGILFLTCTDEEDVDGPLRGGGFGDPETRKAVELAAIEFMKRHLKAKGYRVEDLQHANCGYDLAAVKGRQRLLYEVKGTDSVAPRFFISRNEWKCAQREVDWRLAVVSNARGDEPTLLELDADGVRRQFEFDCMSWECVPKTGKNSV